MSARWLMMSFSLLNRFTKISLVTILRQDDLHQSLRTQEWGWDTAGPQNWKRLHQRSKRTAIPPLSWYTSTEDCPWPKSLQWEKRTGGRHFFLQHLELLRMRPTPISYPWKTGRSASLPHLWLPRKPRSELGLPLTIHGPRQQLYSGANGVAWLETSQ